METPMNTAITAAVVLLLSGFVGLSIYYITR